MRFIDETKIFVASGAGGNGCGGFLREKFNAFGGPNGGDGGRGGDIVLVATHRRTTLIELRGKAIWRAERGEHGRGKQQTGAAGKATEIHVPVGTRVFDNDTGEILADLTADQDRWIAAKGGRGGLGNLHFKTSTNRAPKKTTPGGPGEEKNLRLELMLMADVGLLGFPNAGKSTFISRVSAAKPKIADYPFTTLTPSLGVVDMGTDGSFAIADIPGLVEGASDGAGLGYQFLRHVGRTRVLAHLVSMGEHDEGMVHSGEQDTPDALRRYRAIRHELAAYDSVIAGRPEVIVLTKVDLVEPDVAATLRQRFENETGKKVFVISSATGAGLTALTNALWDMTCAAVEE
ncbi:MAG: GTPase ObgE [Deltaproteobacteria bacterium]|nr:GTPase ObgE [Deltaproteobacteria bacterium]